MMKRLWNTCNAKTRILILTGIIMALGWPAYADSVTCTVTVDGYRVVQRDSGQEILADGFGSLLVPGKPKLPRKIVAVAIPPYTKMTGVTVRAGEEVQLPGQFNIIPTPLFRSIGRENPEQLDAEKKIWQDNYNAVYQSDAPYAEGPGALVRTSAFRKYNLVDVSVTPFSYRPLSRTLSYAPRITIDVSYEPVSSGYDLPLVDFYPAIEREARDFILNYEQARTWYPDGGAAGGKDPNDFVIITTSDLEASVAPLASWEETKGRQVAVVTVEWIDAQYSGPDQAARIRAFLREKYPTSEWGIRDVLLVGHHDEVAMRQGWDSVGYGPPRTDFYYAELSLPDNQSWDLNRDGHYGEPGVDKIDFFSEVNVGRIPWSDPDTVLHICNKSVAYEQSTDPAFKKNMLLLGSFFWEDTDTAKLMEAKVDFPWMADWTLTRMYEQNSTVYSTYDCDYEISHNNAQSVWSSGSFAFVNWAGHGSPTSAHMMGYHSQAFVQASDCANLNDNYPSIIFADSCSNSDTDYNNLGRRMLQQGAVGFVGATNVAMGSPGWEDPSDGSSQTLDFLFTTGVTSGYYTQGGSLQRALRKMYIDGGWYYNHYETYEWSLWGNPGLGLNYTGAPDPIPLVTAPGPWEQNVADVRVFNAQEGSFMMSEMQAYAADKYGAYVAFGDLDNDGTGEIVTGPGPGPIYGPHIRGFKLDGTPEDKISFMAYGTKKFGAKVAVGNLDDDPYGEIITGPGAGAVFGPHVRGWNYDGDSITPIQGVNFMAYGTRSYGVNPAAGDLDGDGYDEIITGAGPGVIFGPHVRGWNYDGATIDPLYSVNYFAYSSKHYGVQVGAGDISGGSREEIITGPGPGPGLGTNVRAFSCETGRAELIPSVNFMAYPELKYGVIVAAGDIDGAGKDEILTGPGPAWENFTHVRGWFFDGATVTPSSIVDFRAFARAPRARYGVNIAID